MTTKKTQSVKMTPAQLESHLSTWIALNAKLSDCTEDEAKQLLQAELEGKKRKQVALRVHSRLNKVRADREREEILKAVKS